MGREAGHRGTRDPRRANPQGPTGTWVQAEGSNGGGEQRGIRQQTQARGAERRTSGGGWRGWVWATSRWMAFCAKKGGGERV